MNAITFRGPDGVATYRAIALKHGLKLYAKTGMRPSRMWTPSRMLRTAGQITGKVYKAGEYHRAIADLTAWINHNGTLGD